MTFCLHPKAVVADQALPFPESTLSTYPTSYIPLDDDTTMSTSGPQFTDLITPSTDVFAPQASDSVPDELTATLEALQDFSDFDSSTLFQPLTTETHSTPTFISSTTVEPSI